jgi:hypothetical protein
MRSKMTLIEHASGKIDELKRAGMVIQLPPVASAVRESAARAMNEPRFQAHASESPDANPPMPPAAAATPHVDVTNRTKDVLVAIGSMGLGALMMYAYLGSQRDGREAPDLAKAVLPVSAPAAAATATASAISPLSASIAVPTASNSAAPAPAAPASAIVDLRAEAESLVRQWAQAWSQRDVDRYLGFYGAHFAPPDNLSRDAWEDRRRQRILGKQKIFVAIDDLRVEMMDGNRAIARFAQTYEADQYRESRATKVLLLAREDNAWRITGEIIPRGAGVQKRQ